MSKWKWTETAAGKAVAGKSGLTQFVGWLNSIFNEDHPWFDYGSMDNTLSSVQNQFTQEGLTGQQKALNDMSMQNVEDQYQRQVTGMQKAGLNPALMYQSGATSAPNAPSGATNGMSMSDLIQAAMVPKQLKMMDAQTDNIKAAADQKRAQTETEGIRQEALRLANEYYPSVQEATLDKIFSEIGVNWSTMDEKDANAALTWSKKFLQDTENQFAKEFYHWRNELEKAQTAEATQAAADHMASAAWTAYQHQYAQSHGALLSGSQLIAIASALAEAISGTIKDVKEAMPTIETVVTKAVDKVSEGAKEGVKKVKSHRKRGLRTQEELDAEDRWKKKSGWQKFRAILQGLD